MIKANNNQINFGKVYGSNKVKNQMRNLLPEKGSYLGKPAFDKKMDYFDKVSGHIRTLKIEETKSEGSNKSLFKVTIQDKKSKSPQNIITAPQSRNGVQAILSTIDHYIGKASEKVRKAKIAQTPIKNDTSTTFFSSIG